MVRLTGLARWVEMRMNMPALCLYNPDVYYR